MTSTVTRKELLNVLNDLLQPQLYKDYCPNGLQVEGKNEIGKIVSGVTACQALIDAAIDHKADCILVHHGVFWHGDQGALVGMKKNRVKALLEHDINLIAYHLPLDGHDRLGNNAQLADKLQLEVMGPLLGAGKPEVGLVGRLLEPVTLSQFGDRVSTALGRVPQCIAGGDHKIQTLAWCSGAAQGFVEQAIQCGVDLYLSGEISEPTVHLAKENNIHYVAAGHHATERYGVQALAQYLMTMFAIEHQFIDIDNPV